ncbi:MAG: DUF4381 domain-containing protein [Gammaproteobacteria bacterium]|nr:MAG: DUF4381 domain-containing protein [Gammaproteobacteria bacterium]
MNPVNGPELRDIHLPPPPSWWPPAPGWWIVGALALALLIVATVYSYKMLQRRRRRLALLAEFERTVAGARDDRIALAAALSAFLRRLALQREPAAATMAGEAWLAHLDRAAGSDEFSTGVGRALLDAPYRAHADYDASALIALVRRTLRSNAAEAAHV